MAFVTDQNHLWNVQQMWAARIDPQFGGVFLALHIQVLISLPTYADGIHISFIKTGAANPTVARRNMTLPGENGQNLVEWRFRKEQTRGKVIVFGRKLRVSAV